MKSARCLFLLVVSLFLLSACASRELVPHTPVPAQDLSGKVASGEYAAGVDNFLLLLDASSSMARPYTAGTRFETTMGLTEALNQTLPELSWQAGVRFFGPRFADADGRSVLAYGMAPHSRAGVQAALDQLERPAGTTPLARALRLSGNDLAGLSGKSALVLFSDGEADNAAAVLQTAIELKEEFGANLCVYPVMVGDSPAGLSLLEQLVATMACGFVSSADRLRADGALADFATKVFLRKAERPVVAVKPAPAPAPVVEREPVYRTEAFRLEVNFDFDRAEIRRQDQAALARFADFLKAHPEIEHVEIAGHTCNMGPAAYNLRLSQRRAESVVRFLVERQGINPQRLTAKGYGLTRPIADNSTVQGRNENRRVEAVVRTVVRIND